MCAAGLDDVVELGGLRLQRLGETLQRRQEVVRDLVECCQMHGGRKDVVRRLPHVHVVVRVHVLTGERCHDLVGVHVRRGPGAGLEDVDRELIVQLARSDPVAGLGDALRLVVVQQTELCVHPRGGGLDASEPARDGCGDRFA